MEQSVCPHVSQLQASRIRRGIRLPFGTRDTRRLKLKPPEWIAHACNLLQLASIAIAPLLPA